MHGTNDDLRARAAAELPGRLSAAGSVDVAMYRARLEAELTLVDELRCAEAFSCVSELLAAVRQEGIRLGPSTGLLASSLLAFALGLSDVDPVATGLVVERYLNRLRELGFFVSLRVSPLQWKDLVRCVRRFQAHGDHDPRVRVECVADTTFGVIVAHDEAGAPGRIGPNTEDAVVALPDATEVALAVRAAERAIGDDEQDGTLLLVCLAEPATFDELVASLAFATCASRSSHRHRCAAFVRAAHDRSGIPPTHPLLAPILAPTRGMLVFQEQVLTITNAVTGLSCSQGDAFRRSWGKRHPKEVAIAHDMFIGEASARGADTASAESILHRLAEETALTQSKAYAVGEALTLHRALMLEATSSWHDWSHAQRRVEDCLDRGRRVTVFGGQILVDP